MSEKSVFERLPKTVVPQNYALSLKPDLEKLTFDGSGVIKIEVQGKTDCIVLNALDLKISKAIYRDESKKEMVPKSIKILEEEEKAILSFGSNLTIGKGQLEMEFQGVLNDKLKGFYRSKYKTLDGEDRFAAVTQFEATDARRAFPCWDEPAIKATFDITLVVPKDRVALSNMNVISDKVIDSNLREVSYATTPIMSTYLLAFVVGEFDYIQDQTSDGILVRVYTPLGKREQGRYALEATVKSLPYYVKYFNIAYPLPKIDLIALADFGSGAMENWGLITYRESCLLIDPKNSSASNKQWVALVVAHELAHQWFGNLVTMEWWTHLWLNEGFASFIEFLCVDHLFPEYDIWTQFVTSTVTQAFELDALENSHPIEVPVGHPSQVREIFDLISYKKGSSVIHMLYRYIGDADFRKGMNVYLNRHAYKNTQTEDLWQSLNETSKKPIAKMMSTWTKQKGFPVIAVSSKQDGKDLVLTLKQEKFSLIQNSDKSLWSIPISFTTSANAKSIAKDILLEAKSIDVRLENVSTDQWVKLNPGVVGFYRVRYSKEMLDQFLPAIKNQSLEPLDRLNLQNDLFALVHSGQASTLDVLQLLEAYTKETNYAVWSSINDCILKLRCLLTHLEVLPQFNAYCQNLYRKIHAKLGWDAVPGESHLDTLLRSLVLMRLVSAKDKAILEEATKRFEDHISEVKTIPADLRSPIYRAAVTNSDEKTFDKMIQLYKDTELHEEKIRIALALSSVPTKELLRKVLDFSISDDVRSQSSIQIIMAASNSTIGCDLTWNFIKEKMDVIRLRYERTPLVSRLMKSVTENFATEEKAKEIENYFLESPMEGADRAIQQAVETIRLNARWLAKDGESIKKYLHNYKI